MKNTGFRYIMLSIFAVTVFFSTTIVSNADTALQIDRDVDNALERLYGESPVAKKLSALAKGILVFPNIIKGGLVIGGQYGVGAFRKGGKSVGYYNTAAASYGLQAGVQSFGYAMFFMTGSAVEYLDKSSGFEVGVGPSVVVVDQGVARTLTTTTAYEDVYVFMFNQKGLMAGLGIQGTKITKINPDK